jgi:phage terminase large subunit-like protein
MTRGEKVCAFIERYCLVPEGKLVGKPLKLMKFQRDFIKGIYDNKHGTSRAYLSVARKNGKSALIAGIVLAHIIGPEARLNSQIVSGARSREQASLVFKLAEKMIRLSPELYKLIKIVPSSKMLIGLPMNVEYKAISAEAGTAHGLSPVLAILDEVGQVRGPTDSFIEAIETAQGAHDDPLLIAISTQAATDGDLFSIWLDDAKNAKDRRIVSHVYSAPEGCDMMDREAWKAANPAMGEFRSVVDLEDFAKQADRLPAKENSFRWLYLNQRIDASSPFLSRSEWQANSADPEVEELDGAECYGGLDLSASRDLTSLILAFPDGDDFRIVSRFFLPSDGIREKAKQDKVPYDIWADQGFLTLIDGPVIIPAVVAMAIAEANERYKIKQISYDRWRINDLKRELDNIGCTVPLVPFGQGFRDMAPAVDMVERLVAERKLRHGGNPILNMCAAGAIVERDPAGNRKLSKSKSASRIDGLVALSMALGGISKDEANNIPPSPWENPDFRITA